MVKVFSPHFHDMKGKIAYKKGRIGKVHFQRNRGNIAMHFTMEKVKPASPLQKQQRQAFKEAALSYRQLTKQQRENLSLWGAMRNDLISGYDWWTKAKLTDISIDVLIDNEMEGEVFLPNRNFEKGNPGAKQIDFYIWEVAEGGDVEVFGFGGIGNCIKLEASYNENSYALFELEKWFSIKILKDVQIKYGAIMKRAFSDYAPKVYLIMLGEDETAYYDEFTPESLTNEWKYYEKQIVAPADIKAVKIGAKALKRNQAPDRGYIDGFRTYVNGRYIVTKCFHPLLQRVMITSEDGSIVYYDSNDY